MKKILVVDNHLIMLGLMEKLLKKHGHQVQTAKDGLAALDILNTWIPDVIFMDLVMPNIGGDKLCQIIRKIPELENVYIAIVSAVAVEDERDVTDFGANTCIVKGPFNQMVKHILEVLVASDQKEKDFLSGKRLGEENVYYREITRELLSIRDHFEVVLGRLSEGILEITHDARVVFANEAALEIIQKPEESVLAKNFVDFFEVPDHRCIRSLLDRKLGVPKKNREENTVKLGAKDITLDFVPLKDRDDKGIVILSDVTDRKRMKAQIIEAMERAEQMAAKTEAANRAKSAFLASMSHEIRTPLNSVIGFTDMLLKSDMNDDQIEYAKTIKQSGEVLLSLINDILDFSKIEAGRLDLEYYDFDLTGTIYHTFELVRPQTAKKPLELLCRIKEGVPRVVIGDAGRFQQVLINIMGNAAKFTDAGEIELTVNLETEKKDRIKLHFSIRDTGIAIPKEKLELIFEAFQQADSSTNRNFGGTGLGLAICRKLAQLMDGEVWAESAIGEGNVFHFTAWFGKSEIQPDKTYSLNSFNGKKVLIVDDNKTHLEILKEILESCKMQVVDIKDREAIISTIQDAIEANAPFDCCIVNYQMNGRNIGKQIRDTHPELSNLSLIAFSAPTERHAKECITAGFDGFLSTPIRKDDLFDMIDRLLGDKKTGGVSEKEKIRKNPVSQTLTDKNSGKNVYILVAEDNLMSQKLVQMMFAKWGFEVEIAENGIEVVEKYTGQPEKFDMIFMDVQMPEMDGLSATKEIRRWEEHNRQRLPESLKRIPIVAFTANALKGDREKCLEAGMDDYMAKPIQVDVVLDTIRKWVREKQLCTV
jgi:signal transduction histidine kinase/DNA-binding response OmpR family regulator